MTINPLPIKVQQKRNLNRLSIHMHLKLATLVFMGLALSGCFGTQAKINPDIAYQYQPQHSPALNLMLASGTMVEDGEIVDVVLERPEGAGENAVAYQNSRESWDNFHDSINVIDSGMVMSGAWAPPIGVSSGFHGGMMLLSLLDSPYKPSFVRTHLVAFMPSDLASSNETAARHLESMMREALSKSMPQGAEYEVFAHKWKPTFGSKTTSLIGVLKGGECDKSQVEFSGPGEQPIHTGCRIYLRAKDDPVRIKSPNWMGDGEVYLFHPDLYKDRNSSRGLVEFWVRIEPKGIDGILDSFVATQQIKSRLGDLAEDKLLLKMTEHMPAWFYVYIAPTKEDPVPKIYQQGKVLYFAKYTD